MKKKQTEDKLLTRYLRQIGEEATELVTDAEGEDKMATKIEAMARLIWRDALGYEEDGKEYKPNRTAQAMIYDRLEGRVANSISEKENKLTAAGRVSEQGANRIAKAGGLNVTGSD